MALNSLCRLTCGKKETLPLFFSLSSGVACSLILLVSLGCGRSQASRENSVITQREAPPGLKLSDDQIAFIENNVSKPIAWQTYWTWRHADMDPFYAANAGRKVASKYISFESAVIVWVNELRIVSVAYVIMPDGRLDYPGNTMTAVDEIDNLIRTGKLRPGNWDSFVMMLDYEPELRSAREQQDKYRTQFTSHKAYSVMDAEITLPPLGPPRYDPLTETKQLLLERILKESVRQVNMMFEKQETATITVPNFNIGDPLIWVLIQDEEGGGVIVSIQLTTNPKEHPVLFGGVVTYDIRANRYGLAEEARITQMIKHNALKTVRYTAKNP